MTPPLTRLFLEEFQAGGATCARCTAPAVKSMCSKHLREARLAFRVWTVRRVAKRLCVRCPGRSLLVRNVFGASHVGVYCRACRERNRRSSLAWARQYRDDIRSEWQRRKAAGVCTDSPAHGKAYRNHTTCRNCYLRRRTYRRAYENHSRRHQ